MNKPINTVYQVQGRTSRIHPWSFAFRADNLMDAEVILGQARRDPRNVKAGFEFRIIKTVTTVIEG